MARQDLSGEGAVVDTDALAATIGLVYADLPIGQLHLIGQGGTTRQDGEWKPVLGVAAAMGDGPFRAQLGLLRGPDYRSPDAGFLWTW